MTKKTFLESAYHLESMQQTEALYSEWAATYDEEITANGYASPQRTAEALVQCGAVGGEALLDIGCGSGVSGYFLQQAGFAELHGCDFSWPMLELAARKNLYKKLHQSSPDNPYSFVEAPYQTAAAVGVMAPGHAGPELISSVLEILVVGGLFGFSMNDHTLDNPAYLQEIERLLKDRQVRIRWNEYGEHLPGIQLNSIIMVIEKLR